MSNEKLTTPDMELAIVEYFDMLRNTIIPNVSWGFLNHEADLLIITKSDKLYEVEIKISLSDLKADKKKTHGHSSNKIKYLYYAIPKYLLEKSVEHIPEYGGILTVERNARKGFRKQYRVELYRKPMQRVVYTLNHNDKLKLFRLGCIRIWTLKKKILKHTQIQKRIV